LFFPLVTLAQSEKILLSGFVSDSLNNPLELASVIIEFEDPEKSTLFSKSDQQGRFSLEIEKNSKGTITISYLGLEKYQTSFNGKEDISLRVQLKGEVKIEEVYIKYNYEPIIIKKDTIVFDVLAFIDGSERKLQDILKNLPGFSVEDGKVKFQGSAVTSTQVDNKSFFGGNTRLAIENIPSDAIFKIEMISHFSEIDFMKDIIASDDLGMNVILKESHKNLFFGDVEVAGGFEKAYAAHASLFLYKPEHSFQIITDWNNTGKEIFSFMDLIHFQGGLNSFSDRSALQSEGLMEMTKVNRDHLSLDQQFAAGNFQKNWNSNLDLTIFGIFNKIKSIDNIKNELNYLFSETIEFRNSSVHKNNYSTWLNTRLEYKPTDFEVWVFRGIMSLNSLKMEDSFSSILNLKAIDSESRNKSLPISWQNNLEWNKKINPQNSIKSEIYYAMKSEMIDQNVFTDDFLFKSLIPEINSEFYNFLRGKELLTHSFTQRTQYYYQLNRRHQFSPIFHINYLNSVLDDHYELMHITHEDLRKYGFGNNIHYTQLDLSFGLHYKFEWDSFILKALMQQSVLKHDFSQIGGEKSSSDWIFNPKIDIEYKFSEVKRLNLSYQYDFSYPQLRYINNSFDLISFNTLYRGLPVLSTERFHTFSTSFRSFNYEKYNIWAYAYFTKRNNLYSYKGLIENHSQILQSFIQKSPEYNFNISLFGERTWRYISPFVILSSNISNFTQVINESEIMTNQYSNSCKIGLKISGKRLPKVTLSYENSIIRYDGNIKSKLQNKLLNMNFDYSMLKVWNIKADYQYVHNKGSDNSSSLVFNNVNTRITYSPKSKSYDFFVDALNITGNKFQVRNFQNELSTSINQTMILPRQILIGLRYRL
jgi:hypothetical protein